MALKSRYYETLIKEQGFERATKMVLMELIEQHNVLEQALITNAQAFDQMTNIIQQFTQVAENMRNKADELEKKLRPDLPGVHTGSEPVE